MSPSRQLREEHGPRGGRSLGAKIKIARQPEFLSLIPTPSTTTIRTRYPHLPLYPPTPDTSLQSTMANQQQALVNLNAAPANPQQAAAAPPHAPGRENVPPIPTTPVPFPRPSLSPATLGPHNGQLSPHTPYQSEQTFAEEAAIPDWPFRGPEGPLQRTRIEGFDELVFGAF
ncbi:uncharacterized protein TRAVEDRAFT_50502 [Trametes versicolor FP-101664 SS1]|uniref:uncharacterized protein n=1 Tax=Trametes versicolor (strain FP-101664) TaxID=717944 RepID=UPI00046214C9|nr:uncharacterized protein TRAVEDRAFT_50502 [Trametes versicolor FP-101664 SS1]EIW56010.1 hypothetical protein TRAVEDRAFT_50502 [Trametes versicolor FP-101664 SS1]